MFAVLRIAILTSALLLVANTLTLAQGDSFYVHHKKTSLDLEQCKQRAMSVLRNAGFQNVRALRVSATGSRGGYAGFMRCAPDVGAVVVVVVGPKLETCDRYANQLHGDF
jgi:hypothetical protein